MLFVITPSVILLSVVMLFVIMPGVIMLIIMAPLKDRHE